MKLSFLLWGYGDPRGLPSFPTRRSSDLPWTADVVYRLESVGAHQLQGGQSQPGARQQVSADRKSTRLNSSHVEISYAVFCLKKKINFTKPLETVSTTEGTKFSCFLTLP